MDVSVLEDACDVPTHGPPDVGAEFSTLALAVAEMLKATFGAYPSKFLVHHIVRTAHELSGGAQLPRAVNDQMTLALRAACGVVAGMNLRMRSPVALDEARSAGADVLVRRLAGDELQRYLEAKRRAKMAAAQGKDDDVMTWEPVEPFIKSPLSGRAVRVRGDVVRAFARRDAPSLRSYVAALDNEWNRAERVGIVDCGGRWLTECGAASVFLGERPDVGIYGFGTYSAILEVHADHVVVCEGPLGLRRPVDRWERPTWCPNEAWAREFMAHALTAAATARKDAAAIGPRGYVQFLRKLSARLTKLAGPYAAATAAIRRREVAGGHAIVAVDTRRSIMTALSVYVAAVEARAAGFSNFHVMTAGDANAAWYRELLDPVMGHGTVQVRSVPPEFQGRTFDPDAYSVLLKTPGFWKALAPSAKALVVQDDGFLLDGTALASFLKYDYVGAPWAPENIPDLIALAGDNLVGNGGLSLRSVPLMAAIAEETPTAVRDMLFINNMMILPEDVLFTVQARARGGTVCPVSEASEFSSEQLLPEAGKPVAGVHKVWHYHGLRGVDAVFASIGDRSAAAPVRP